MGKGDYNPYDKNYWNHWTEHNKETWKNWAEPNKEAWKNWAEPNKEAWRNWTKHNKDTWKNWKMSNKDYWAKWAEHNQDYMNHAQRYSRRCGRGGVIGKVVFFGLGYLAASFVNRRYHTGSDNPREAWEKMKAAADNLQKDQPDGSQDSAELRDLIDKMKQLEKRYRRPQPSDEGRPSTSDPPAPQSSE